MAPSSLFCTAGSALPMLHVVDRVVIVLFSRAEKVVSILVWMATILVWNSLASTRSRRDRSHGIKPLRSNERVEGGTRHRDERELPGTWLRERLFHASNNKQLVRHRHSICPPLITP